MDQKHVLLANMDHKYPTQQKTYHFAGFGVITLLDLYTLHVSHLGPRVGEKFLRLFEFEHLIEFQT